MSQTPPRSRIALRSSLYLSALPATLSYAERFAMAARAGIQGVEVEATPDGGEVHAMRDAAAATGVRIHCIQTCAHWDTPFTSADPAIAAASIRATLTALENARALGADSILIVPGRVDATTSYSQAYQRAQAIIKSEVLPAAKQMGIVLGIENAWNGFLLGPLEYARFIDEFESEWVRAHLDVGNVVSGRPQDWIDIVGARICKLHVKDVVLNRWGRAGRPFLSVRVGAGRIDWDAVCEALARVGFTGWATNAALNPYLFGRGMDYLMRSPRRARIARIPGAMAVLRPIQRRAARRALDDTEKRFHRYLQ